MSLVVGFDVGTQGTKGVALDVEGGRVVARAAATYGLIEGLPDGAAEQHPRTWLGALREVSRRLMASAGVDAGEVVALGVSGQQHGLVVLDEAGVVVRPAKLWCDTSTAAEARELSEVFGEHVPTGYTASKVLWLARHEPEGWGRARHVLLPHDYVNFRLTGDLTMEAGDASGTGFFDSAQRRFDLVRALRIDPRLPEMLPPVFRAGAMAGVLSREGALLLGMPPGVPVSAGGGDNMMSAIGSGATRPGVAVVSLGTSGTIFAYSDEPVVDPEGLIAPFCGSAGGWLPLLCVMNLTGVGEEVRAAFGMGHEELTRLALEVAPGCGGLLWLPYLVGERVPDLPDARGALVGMGPGSLRAGVLYRAAVEGTASNLAWGAERMRRLGIAFDELRVVGGAARNPLWRQMLADTLATPVTLLAESESAALGAAIQALWALQLSLGGKLGIDAVATPFVHPEGPPTAPDPARVAIYRELGTRFRELAGRLYGAIP